MRKAFKIVIAVFAILIVLFVSAFAAIAVDATSLTATDTQTLNPDGASVGNALVVYNPGFSGAAKAAAEKIAADLQAAGYTVDLAGVKSSTAHSSQDYDVVVAGGPMYWGQIASSIDGYLKAQTLPTQTKLGIYGTTGSSEYSSSDLESLQQQIASATNNHPVTIQMVLDGNETQNTADLVSALIH